MKRRTFLTAASTVGVIGAASGATTISSVYNSLNSNALLAEFDDDNTKAFEKLLGKIKENAETLGIDEKIAKRLAMPTFIISKNSTGNKQNIVYKNRAGHTISFSKENGVDRFRILKTA